MPLFAAIPAAVVGVKALAAGKVGKFAIKHGGKAFKLVGRLFGKRRSRKALPAPVPTRKSLGSARGFASLIAKFKALGPAPPSQIRFKRKPDGKLVPFVAPAGTSRTKVFTQAEADKIQIRAANGEAPAVVPGKPFGKGIPNVLLYVIVGVIVLGLFMGGGGRRRR